MPQAQWRKLRKALEAKRLEVADRIARARDRIRIERSADSMDDFQRAGEREMAVLDLQSRYNLLQEIEAAFERMEQGAFGFCVHCDAAIPAPRLVAVPWTPFCIRCQEAVDRGDLAVLETRDSLHAPAA
jgi:DnaK suppressor protein